MILVQISDTHIGDADELVYGQFDTAAALTSVTAVSAGAEKQGALAGEDQRPALCEDQFSPRREGPRSKASQGTGARAHARPR